jgi:hypothetical protein
LLPNEDRAGGAIKKPTVVASESLLKRAKESPEFQRATQGVDFNKLVSAGCDPEVLEWLLIRLHESRWRDDPRWLRGAGRELKTILARIRQCADDVQCLQRTPAGLAALDRAEAECQVIAARDYWALPQKLRTFADCFERAAPQQASRTRPQRNLVIAELVAYVHHKTVRLHDAEVSALISDVLDRPNYSVQTHKDWRREHAPLIKRQYNVATAYVCLRQRGR